MKQKLTMESLRCFKSDTFLRYPHVRHSNWEKLQHIAYTNYTALRVRTKSVYTVFPWISDRVPLKNFGFKEEHVLGRGRLSEGSAY